MKKSFLLVFLCSSFFILAKPVQGPLDMQVHLTTHMLYSAIVGKTSPLDSEPNKTMTNKHRCKQAAFESQIWQNSSPLFLITALDDFFNTSRRHTIKIIHQQFAFIKKLVAQHPDRYAIAKTPAEAREIIHSGRKAFILAIEGGGGLLRSQADADYWAKQGVASIGIIHLKDNEYGSATIMKGGAGILNFGARFKGWFGCRKKGLSPLGKQVVSWLAQAGILTDMSHMNKAAIHDTLDLAERLNVPVIATHSLLQGVTGDKNDLTDSMVKRIYRLGGLIGITSGIPQKTKRGYQGMMPRSYCAGSYQELAIQGSHLQQVIGSPENFSIGFATDMNGMVDHYRPMYGRKGCFYKRAKIGHRHLEQNRNFDSFDIYGLNHFGAVNHVWENLRRDSYDVKPFMNSAETFLKIWERMLDSRFGIYRS